MSAVTRVVTAADGAHAERSVGEPVELARYTIPESERVLVGRRVHGIAIVVDVPAGDSGRVYLVERDVARDGNQALQSLLADYVSVAQRLGAVPMASSPLGSWLREPAP